MSSPVHCYWLRKFIKLFLGRISYFWVSRQRSFFPDKWHNVESNDSFTNDTYCNGQAMFTLKSLQTAWAWWWGGLMSAHYDYEAPCHAMSGHVMPCHRSMATLNHSTRANNPNYPHFVRSLPRIPRIYCQCRVCMTPVGSWYSDRRHASCHPAWGYDWWIRLHHWWWQW